MVVVIGGASVAWLYKIRRRVKRQLAGRLPDGTQLKTGTDDLDDAAFRRLQKTRKCPDCGGGLLEGPSGGCSINVTCDKCGHRFNIAVFMGDIAMAQRI